MSLSSRKGPSPQDVFDAALRLLSYRPRSESELQRRLSKRFPLTLVDAALLWLKERELVDDAAFARFWRRAREQSRPKGASALTWELIRMGVSRDVVAEALEGLDEEENAYRAGSRILRRMGQTGYADFRRKIVPYLRRKGFNLEVSDRTSERLWEELSDTVDGSVEGQRHQE